MFGGGVNSMEDSLRSNKELLNRRKTFFDQKHSYGELKKLYSKRIDQNDKTASEAEKEFIRDKIRLELKRRNLILFLVYFTCIVMLIFSAYLAFSFYSKETDISVSKISIKEQAKIYDESIQYGLINLKRKEAFFAIGHFKNALEVKPNDQYAVQQLILSYQMLCEQNVNSCNMTKSKIDSLLRMR